MGENELGEPDENKSSEDTVGDKHHEDSTWMVTDIGVAVIEKQQQANDGTNDGD